MLLKDGTNLDELRIDRPQTPIIFFGDEIAEALVVSTRPVDCKGTQAHLVAVKKPAAVSIRLARRKY